MIERIFLENTKFHVSIRFFFWLTQAFALLELNVSCDEVANRIGLIRVIQGFKISTHLAYFNWFELSVHHTWFKTNNQI